jgi:hypothetical protein
MLNSFYIISEISNQIYKVLKKNSGINVIYRPNKQDKDNNNWLATGVRKGYEDFDCEPEIK